MATQQEVKRLNQLIGNQRLKREEIEEFRRIIESSGSLLYSQQKAIALVAEGKQALLGSRLNEEARDFLSGIADYIINREI
jgi:geranylgeranyl pyrophosphate synthase